VNPQMFYGPCRVTSRTVAVPLGVLTSLCPYDPSRIVLVIGVAGVNAVQVAPRRTLTSTSGIQLTATGTSLIQLDFSAVGPMVGMEWFGNAGAATVVEVIEVFRDEDPERRLGPPPEV
jgi:hypothetical protein